MREGRPGLEIRIGPSDGLGAILERHPHVRSVAEGGSSAIEFQEGGRTRRVLVGDQRPAVRGLIETMDNNPIVCADEVSVPSPAGTLALVALAPLLRGGLVVEPPSLSFTIEADPKDVSAWLATEGWAQGATVLSEPMELKGAAACTAMAVIATPSDLDDLDSLYEEAYGRALYVRRDEESEWDVQLVLSKPFALYRLRVTPDESTCLLAIQVMVDLRGKCGAAQIVHAMNLMAGFEESLGIGE